MKHDICKDLAAQTTAPERICLCTESCCAVLEFQAALLEIQAQRQKFARDCKSLRETLAFGVAAE